jgi:hypothetical protein
MSNSHLLLSMKQWIKYHSNQRKTFISKIQITKTTSNHNILEAVWGTKTKSLIRNMTRTLQLRSPKTSKLVRNFWNKNKKVERREILILESLKKTSAECLLPLSNNNKVYIKATVRKITPSAPRFQFNTSNILARVKWTPAELNILKLILLTFKRRVAINNSYNSFFNDFPTINFWNNNFYNDFYIGSYYELYSF